MYQQSVKRHVLLILDGTLPVAPANKTTTLQTIVGTEDRFRCSAQYTCLILQINAAKGDGIIFGRARNASLIAHISATKAMGQNLVSLLRAVNASGVKYDDVSSV